MASFLDRLRERQRLKRSEKLSRLESREREEREDLRTIRKIRKAERRRSKLRRESYPRLTAIGELGRRGLKRAVGGGTKRVKKKMARTVRKTEKRQKKIEFGRRQIFGDSGNGAAPVSSGLPPVFGDNSTQRKKKRDFDITV